MEFSFFFKGLIIGLSIAAPVGSIGVLCIQRTYSFGRMSGLLTGLGAATADGLYGTVAAFGLTFISSFLVGQQFWFRLVGGIFLLYLGIKTFLDKPIRKVLQEKHKSLLSDYFSTVFLTITNPMTILSFVAVFAGLGLGDTNGNLTSAFFMTTGVFVGSALWWFILSGGVNYLKTKFNILSLSFVNKISGVIITVFAILAFLSIV